MNALILNSAQGKYPRASEPWAENASRAVKYIADAGYTALVSGDPLPWDFTSWLTAIERMPLTFIVPGEKGEISGAGFDSLPDEYGFERERASLSFIGGSSGGGYKQAWRERDLFAIKHADLILPISIRSGGRLERLINGRAPHVKLCNDFKCEWGPVKHAESYDFEEKIVNPLPHGDWIIHWTRASQGPWPDERKQDFFKDFAARPNEYVRSALDTLKRIVASKQILGSATHMPGGMKAVSCSSLSIEDALPLMRWRKRYSRYTFEAFGLGIRREAFMRAGGREVTYRDRKSSPDGLDPLFIQSPGEIGDWTKEREWRIKGDLAIDTIDRDDIILIVPDMSAQESLIASGMDVCVHRMFDA